MNRVPFLHRVKTALASVLVLPLILAGCTQSNDVASASSSVAAPETQAADATLPDDADPAMWVIKDEDTTVYLFGTVHILKPGMTWFDEAVKDAFDASDELVMEMIEPDPTVMMQLISTLAMDQTGKTLRSKLTDEDRADFEKAMAALNLPVASFDPLEPWFASVSMSMIPLAGLGYDPASGVEKTLTTFAQAKGMTITGLETPDQQLGFFDNLPEDAQIRYLNATVDGMGEIEEGMAKMVAFWARGNMTELAALMNEGLEDKRLFEALLSNRNAAWADWVQQRLYEPGVVFMAVGAGHLAGDDSVQDFLKTKGLIAERIIY